LLKRLEKARRVRAANLKKKNRPTKRVVVKRSSGNSRAELLRRLAKARRVRAANLKKRNRPTKRVVVKRSSGNSRKTIQG
jgi:hypothetical protein